MNFNRHSHLREKHAFLSPSNYHWINYSEERLDARYTSFTAAYRGTKLHDLAHDCIMMGVRLPKSPTTLNLYVNDGIGFKMTCEQPLFYSENCFGHADTISFRKDVLRIHDLKTGTSKASPKQLEVYAAIFCLEYGFSPFDIRIELRIYQNNEGHIYEPTPEGIIAIMDKIITFDRRIELLKEGLV